MPGWIRRASAVAVLAPVWVVDPQEGTKVGRPLRLSGSASVFEATVSWEITRGGSVVRSGFATASQGAPGRGTWLAVIRGLGPGSYQVAAWETSMKDGSELSIDDKAFSVR